VEVVASLSQGRTAAAQCSLFTHKSVPVIFEPPYSTVVTIYAGHFIVLGGSSLKPGGRLFGSTATCFDSLA